MANVAPTWKFFNRNILLANAGIWVNGVEVITSTGTVVVGTWLTYTTIDASGNVEFGTTSADTMQVNSTSTFSAPVIVGVDDTGYDVKLFGATSGKSWLWDESADKMIVTGASDLLGATQQTGTLTVGVDATGYDVKFFGDTTGKSRLWDESADTMIVTGLSTFSDNLTVASGKSIIGAGTGANGIVLKNLKNQAAGSLSGTQLTVVIDIGGTPYYFLVSPTIT